MQVVDSSIYIPHADLWKKDYSPNYIGTIISCVFHEKTQSLVYEVEVLIRNSPIKITCKPLYQYSSPLNYQEFYIQTHEIKGDSKIHTYQYSYRVGDIVFVSFIGNDVSSGGYIIGSLAHSGKKIKINEEINYYSIFNGIEEVINKNGEYTVTRKGIPSNLKDILTHSSNTNIPEPKYDSEDSGTFFSFKKDGSFEINDSKQQFFQIDRTKKVIKIQSNKCLFEFGETSKDKESLFIKTPQNVKIEAGTSIFQIGNKTNGGPSSFFLKCETNGIIQAKSVLLNASSGVTISGSGISCESKGTSESKCNTMKISATSNYTLSSPSIKISASNSFSLSSSKTKIESQKLYIGNSVFEILRGLIEIIDSIGTLSPPYHYGPIPPLRTSPTWAKLETIKAKIKSLI